MCRHNNTKPKSWLLRFDAAAPILQGIAPTTAHLKAPDESFLLSSREQKSMQGWLCFMRFLQDVLQDVVKLKLGDVGSEAEISISEYLGTWVRTY